MTKRAYFNAKRFRIVFTSYGKHVCSHRLVSEHRLIRQGAELPDYARYKNL